jgi:hypothetical protein
MRIWKATFMFALLGAVAAPLGCGEDTTAPAATRGEVATEAPADTPAVPPAPEPTDAAAEAANAGPKDGELALPAGYKEWPVFLQGVQRTDVKQIRDIYINGAAQAVAAGEPLPPGSVLVMEIYGAKVDDAGEAVLGESGEMERAGLSKVFVMGKGPGWQGGAPENGEWVYAAYNADGLPDDTAVYATCRSCHVPQQGDDFVFRLGEYIAARDGGESSGE